jgi:hypothetical protein
MTIVPTKHPQKKSQTKNINKIEGFYYLTEKILMCPYPEESLIEKVANYMNETHANHYIVYNLSEHKYDNSYFNNSVIITCLTLLLGHGVLISWHAMPTTGHHVHDL